jgi:thioredoxin reductase (NADPH)
MDYDVIIVGVGPAGLSAGIYLGRAKVKTLMIGKKADSQLAKAHNIENYFGFPEGIMGKDLLENGIKQAKKFDVEIVDGEAVDAKPNNNGFTIKLGNGKKHNCKAMVIATGTPIKLTGILKEEELTGKGVHYCVECDGAFYQDKKVAVIGNGNHAAEGALDLQTFTKNVTIFSNGEDFDISFPMKKELEKEKVKLAGKKVKAFEGEKKLENVVFADGSKAKFDAVFMACGTASALNFAAEMGLIINENILEVDSNNMTNVKGVFAAGNCAGKCRQVAKNVGEGCNAGLGAIKFLRNKKVYFDYSR